MISFRRKVIDFLIFYTPDNFLIIFMVFLFSYFEFNGNILLYLVPGVVVLIFLRTMILLSRNYRLNTDRANRLKEVVSDFKKGKSLKNSDKIKGNDQFSSALKELVVMGKNFENIISTQRDEIEKSQDLYNSVLFSIDSFFVVIGYDDKAIFANEGFYRKFMFEKDEVIGKSIDEIFDENESLKDGILRIKSSEKSIILEKVHLLSANSISFIADIKISNIMIYGREQIIIILEDITNRVEKDYQVSLLSRITESIHKNVEIERILQTTQM